LPKPCAKKDEIIVSQPFSVAGGKGEQGRTAPYPSGRKEEKKATDAGGLLTNIQGRFDGVWVN